jgi:hypothetical protein
MLSRRPPADPSLHLAIPRFDGAIERVHVALNLQQIIFREFAPLPPERVFQLAPKTV